MSKPDYAVWGEEIEDTETDEGLWRAQDDNRLPSPKIEPKEEEE